MGLIRLIIFALVIWMFWRLIKNYQASLNNKKQASGNKKLDNKNMVACHYCTVHVPEQDAVGYDQLWFCSEAHKAKYLAEKQ